MIEIYRNMFLLYKVNHELVSFRFLWNAELTRPGGVDEDRKENYQYDCNRCLDRESQEVANKWLIEKEIGSKKWEDKDFYKKNVNLFKDINKWRKKKKKEYENEYNDLAKATHGHLMGKAYLGIEPENNALLLAIGIKIKVAKILSDHIELKSDGKYKILTQKKDDIKKLIVSSA